MSPFQYSRPSTIPAALREMQNILAANPPPRASFLAGGTSLLDLMKLNVVQPQRIIDLNALRDEFGAVRRDGQHLRLGAFATMAKVTADPMIAAEFPVIAQSLALAASAALRNMATLGGNVLQRTRCAYFRDPSWTACNKRVRGSGCAAREGASRMHAVLGTSDHCIAAYPGDFAQALIALDASVAIIGSRGSRIIPFSDLHRMPAATPDVESTLHADEIIVEFIVPAQPWTRRSVYLKIRDRQSYEFAVASAAVALDLDGTMVREARIALGGVATVPWRSQRAEAMLRGGPITEDNARAAARLAFLDAVPQSHNAFKVSLGESTLVRALMQTASLEIHG